MLIDHTNKRVLDVLEGRDKDLIANYLRKEKDGSFAGLKEVTTDMWDGYVEAYEDALSRCSTDVAPWFVIPANKKWFRNLAVSHILVHALERLDLKFPKPSFDVSRVKLT